MRSSKVFRSLGRRPVRILVALTVVLTVAAGSSLSPEPALASRGTASGATARAAAPCRLAAAVFCETFDGPRNRTGNRNGDFSTARMSAARWSQAHGSEPAHVDRAQIPPCRRGAVSNPLPPGDTLICGPSSVIRSRYGLVSTAMQAYGDNTYRIARPFDIVRRTGTISFNASLYTEGGLLGWPVITYTAGPYSVPSYLADNASGATPRRGLQVHFNSVCPGPAGWTRFVTVRIHRRFREHVVHDANGFEDWCTSNVRTQPGRLNHVKIRLSRTHIAVWISNASSDGVHFGRLKKVFSAPINLGFTRGSVYFGVHNHATDKYAGLPSWTVLWDNIGFDGPFRRRQRVSQVNNAAVADGGGLNLGYALPNSRTGNSTRALHLPNVSTRGIRGARLVFNLAADPISNRNWAAWRVNYRLNGRRWHSVGLSPAQLTMMDRAGSYIFSVPVSPRELVSGTNTVRLSGTNFYAGYRPYIANIDLVVR